MGGIFELERSLAKLAQDVPAELEKIDWAHALSAQGTRLFERAGRVTSANPANAGDEIRAFLKNPSLSDQHLIIERRSRLTTAYEQDRNIQVLDNGGHSIVTAIPSGKQLRVDSFYPNSQGPVHQFRYVDRHPGDLRTIESPHGPQPYLVETQPTSRQLSSRRYWDTSLHNFPVPSEITTKIMESKPVEINESALKSILEHHPALDRKEGRLVGFDRVSGEALFSPHDRLYDGRSGLTGYTSKPELYPVPVTTQLGQDFVYRSNIGETYTVHKLEDDYYRMSHLPNVFALKPSEVHLDSLGRGRTTLAQALGLSEDVGLRAQGGYWTRLYAGRIPIRVPENAPMPELPGS